MAQIIKDDVDWQSFYCELSMKGIIKTFRLVSFPIHMNQTNRLKNIQFKKMALGFFSF